MGRGADLDCTLEITIDAETRAVAMGETLRYRGDWFHRRHNATDELASAAMVNSLKATVTT